MHRKLLEDCMAILTDIRISREVKNPTRDLLKLLEVHQIIQVWYVDENNEIHRLSPNDPVLHMRVRIEGATFYATPRSVLVKVQDMSAFAPIVETAKRLAQSAAIDWNSAAGQEFAHFTTYGRWDNLGHGASGRHNHYLPELKTPMEVAST